MNIKQLKYKKMKVYQFNDVMGSRNRDCVFGVIHNDVYYTPKKAEENKLAVFEAIDRTKNGKWSNTTWKVTLNSAALIVAQRPFSGWSSDLNTCVIHIQDSCSQYIGYRPSYDEAYLFFRSVFSEFYEEITKKEKNKLELL